MLCLLIVFTLSVYDYQDSHLNAKHFAINILVVAVIVNYFEPVWTTKNHHSISVTHHSSLITHFFTLIWQHHFYFHHSIFSHYSWVPHLSAGTVLFFFFGLALAGYWKKKKKTNSQRQPRKRKEKKRKEKKIIIILYRLTGVGPMNSVKKLSDENKSDVAKWVWKNEWWVMESDGNWVMKKPYPMSDEWWVMGVFGLYF